MYNSWNKMNKLNKLEATIVEDIFYDIFSMKIWKRNKIKK